MKIGFGIICYDKFEEVRILADILKGFEKDFYVLVCSNHPDAAKHLGNYLNIDRVVLGEDLPFNGNMDKEQRRIHLNVMRVTTNIQACNKALIENEDLDYCVFLHSDAWILDRNSIYRIIELLKNKDKKIAFRGVGISAIIKVNPFGNLDDMFIFYERKFIKESKMFEFDVLQMFPHKLNSHGMIMTNMVVKVGLANMLQYKNTLELYFWKNRYINEKTTVAETNNPTTPCTYDPDYKFIHINVASFPDDLGLQMQAYYLRKFKLRGPTIDKFLKKYTMSEKELFTKIKEIDKRVKRILMWHFLSYKTLGWTKNYTKILKFFKTAPLKEKIWIILVSNLKQLIVKTIGLDRLLDIVYGAKIKERMDNYYKRIISSDKRIDQYKHKRWYLDFKDKDL